MTIKELNKLNDEQLKLELEKCCGAESWVNKMLSVFPVLDEDDLLNIADEKWAECKEIDWLEAFKHHPKIGDISSLKKKFANTAKWAEGEQSGMNEANENTIEAFAKANDEYEKKFGFIFIVCATGKSAAEMLEILNYRMNHNLEHELHVAAAEQSKITKLRLQKLLT